MLVLSSVLFLLIAGSAAAADETAPIVDVPEDVPGADVIVFFGDAYDFDASNSIDDTGIVDFMWEFNDGGNPVMLYSTTGKTSYTFTSYGQTWVTVHAWDAAGNEGKGYFSIDVVQVVTGDMVIRDTTAYLPHSYYIDDGDLVIDNSTVLMDEGAGRAGGGGGAATAPDQLGESLTPDGDFSGMWTPYYYHSYWKNGNNYYGRPYLDTNTKFSGDASIRISSGSYYYGAEYHFDSPQDLTEYDMLNFWFKSSYSSYPYYCQVYFYSSSTSYSGQYCYVYNYGVGYYASYYGWYGMSISLDTGNVGRIYWYGGMNDLSSVSVIRFYSYGYRYMSNYWIDHVGFSQFDEPADPIMESTVNTGDFAGRWSSTYSSPSTSTHSYAGDYSIAFPVRSYYRETFYYRFDQPTDLSTFDAIRFYTYFSAYYYVRWYNYQMYVYTTSGYGYYYIYGSSYMNYYTSYYDGRWDMRSMPWGPQSGLYRNYGVDWTQVTEIRLDEIYSYRASTLYLDGFTWVTAGKAEAGVPTDNVPLAIYNPSGDTVISGDSRITGLAKTGARIATMDGSARIQHATLDNMWVTETPVARNGVNVFGGLEVYGDVVADNITFQNCPGPGMALFDGQYTLDTDTIDLTGTALKAKMAPQLIMGVSEDLVGQYTLDVTGWKADASPSGTGILLMFVDTQASIDVTVAGNDLDGNKFAGLVIANTGGGSFTGTEMVAGTTADLDLVIKDQEIDGSGSYGIVYYAGGGLYDPNVWATVWIENVTVTRSGEAGLAVMLDMGGTNLDVTMVNSTFERNSGVGAGFQYNGFFGECNVMMDNCTFIDNSGSGLEIVTQLNPWDDGSGNIVSPVASINFEVNASFFQANSGWGIVERFNGFDQPDGGMAPPWNWNGPTRTTLWYNMTMTLSDIMENQAGGWKSKPDQGWYHGDYVAKRDISECQFTDNRGPAVYIEPEHHMEGGGGTVSDVYIYADCRIVDNSRGVENNLASDNQGYYGEVHLTGTRIEDNDAEAIMVSSYWTTDGLYRWGTSRVRGMMYFVDDCRINTRVQFDLIGADDSGGPWDAIMGLQFTHNIVDIDEETIYYNLGAYPSCSEFTAWAEIGHNRFYRPYIENGIDVTMFGGWNLNMDVTILDQDIDAPVGSGINIVAGTLASSSNPHLVEGKVMVDNVTISDAGSNGINFTVDHRNWIGAKSLAVLNMNGVIMDNVHHGILANDATGAVYNTVILEPRASSIELQYCTFDFFSCEVGPVSTANIRVLTKGAARLWYDVGVDVKWASGARVMGAVVSVQDNTWSTIAVDTVDRDDVLNIGYVNSYTVLPDTTYSKSPFLLTGTYLGLSTIKSVDIKSNTIVDLILVDNVLPRLTVNLPLDGSKQRETSLEVKGHAWDLHSGLMSVELSIDGGETWQTATGDPDFMYMYDSVPEGNLMLLVKAVDYAGNERTEVITVLVDATPPPIIIIEPENDVILTQDPMLTIIGVTEIGATVMVNNELVALDHTLFSTEITLNEGSNEVRIEAYDRLGNSAAHVISVELDTIAPPLIVTAPESGVTIGKKTVRVYGQTEAGAMVYVGGSMAANQMGQFSHTVMLSEGPNFIVVTSQDAAGNMATTVVEVHSDTQVPWVRLASPMEGDVFGPSGIEIIGWVEAGSTVTVNDQEVQVTDAHFTTTIMGSEGRNLIVVTVSDMAGNEHSENVEVWFDTTAPEIDLWTPEDGHMTSMDTVEITGTLMWNEDRESFRDITLSINGDFAPFAADGEFNIQYDLVEGTNPLFIRATDDVGNTDVITVTVYKDSMAPFLLVEATPTFDHPTWNKPSTYNGLVYIEGTTENGAMVTVDGAGVEVDESGRFNVSILLEAVPEGEELVQRSIVVVSTDMAGNSVEETVEVYRLQKEETATGLMDYDSAQYWVLFLSIVILVVGILGAAFMWRRIGAKDEEYEEDLYLEEV